jgi:hypothetical protein
MPDLSSRLYAATTTLAVGACLLCTSAAARAQPPAPAQKQIIDAVGKAVDYLKKKQQPNGSWSKTPFQDQYAVGTTALVAQSLLEAGVPANDPGIQKAAAFIRDTVATKIQGQHTYHYSCAILFLDRLGDKQDGPLIRRLGLRLIAGQRGDGGWSYPCPLLQQKDADDLLKYLEASKSMPMVVTAKGEIVRIPNDGAGPLPAGAMGLEVVFPELPLDKVPASLKKMPITFRMPAGRIPTPANPKGRHAELPLDLSVGGPTDNSNTMFAMMALWAARKHGLLVDKSLALVEQHFLSTQKPDGRWNYREKLPENAYAPSPSMTCAGLIGIGLGHFAHKESLGKAEALAGLKAAKDNPAVDRGLVALGKLIDAMPANWQQHNTFDYVHFFWSVQRVAALYDVKTIGGKDWYAWLANPLVTKQNPDGSWFMTAYASFPTVQASWAVLALQRPKW